MIEPDKYVRISGKKTISDWIQAKAWVAEQLAAHPKLTEENFHFHSYEDWENESEGGIYISFYYQYPNPNYEVELAAYHTAVKEINAKFREEGRAQAVRDLEKYRNELQRLGKKRAKLELTIAERPEVVRNPEDQRALIEKRRASVYRSIDELEKKLASDWFQQS